MPCLAHLPRRTWLAAAAGCCWGAAASSCASPAHLSFGSIALTGFAAKSLMAAELRQQLALQVLVLDSPDKADVVLHALEDVRERSVVASTSTAQVRELQLRVKLHFTRPHAGWARTDPACRTAGEPRPELQRNRRAGQGI
jgi:outer membrane lipopolysaccharide assembly protein LptE/RlpB